LKHLRVLLLALLASAIVLAAASPAGAWYQRYVYNAIWAPGSIAGSAYNSITYNAVSFSRCCGGTPYMGTTLQRTDGTGPGYLWSNSGSIFDSRTMAYGHAICIANAANQYKVYIAFCDTGNT
jgi:hypothetical protein